MSICSNCDGDRVLHQPKCLSNDSFDPTDCNCKPTRCTYCRGEGIKRKKTPKKLNIKEE